MPETSQPVISPSSRKEPHLNDYLRVLVARRWALIGVAGALILMALAYVLVQKPVYRATCRLLIQPTKASVVNVKEVYDPTFGADAGSQMLRREFLETQYLLIVSPRNLELAFYDPSLGFSELPQFKSGKDPVKSFSKRFSVSGFRNSYLANVSFEWEDRDLARRTLEYVVRQYVQSARARALGVTEGGLSALQAKEQELRSQVDAKTQKLQAFMSDHNMVSLEQSQDIVVERLKELNRNVTAAETARIQAQSRLKSTRDALSADRALEDLPEVVDSPTVRDLKLEYIRLKLRVSNLGGSFGPKHPEMLAAQEALDAIADKMASEVRHVLTSAQAEFDRAAQLESELRKALDAQEKAVLEFNRLASDYRLLKDSHENSKRAYDTVLQRIQEIGLAMSVGSQEEGVFLEDPVKVGPTPVRPRPLLTLGLAGMLGIFLGVCFALFIDYLDTSIKTREDVEAVLNAPVLGYVPSFSGENGVVAGTGHALDLLAVDKPRSIAAESFRAIRTALSFTRMGETCQQFVVTSALPSEGKTLISVNVAIALAQGGKRVLLADADLRRPRIHRIFNLPSGAVGLSTLLASDSDLGRDGIVHKGVVPNLDVICSGPIPPNPAELLASARAVALIKELAGRYDYIVYDTPPSVNVTDSAVLGRLVHGMILVVRSFSTDRAAAAMTRELLNGAGVRLLGVVLNGVDAPRGGNPYYGYYYKSRYYGDRAGAGTPQDSPGSDDAATGPA